MINTHSDLKTNYVKPGMKSDTCYLSVSYLKLYFKKKSDIFVI